MLIILKIKSLGIFLVILSFVFTSMAYAKDIKIALRANKGAAKGLAKWQATADYLSKKIPGNRFIMVPYENNSALNQAVSLGNFHFCITNPASGVEHQIRYGTQPLATLVNKRRGKGYSQFGSVIFTRADRDDINTLQDTKGKIFIGVDELGFGGWRVAWNELLENNINPYTDYSELRFAGGIQQNVVYAVRDKNVAAGSVRTDMLERMAAAGKIKLSDFKVLSGKKTKGFPFLHSTKLYPEWMFSSTKEIDEKFKTEVINALLSIQSDSSAAKKGKYVKWIEPQDYSSVNNLLKKLKVGPYDISTMGAVKSFTVQYGSYLVFVIIVISLLLLIILYVLRLNKKIIFSQKALQQEIDLTRQLEQQLFHSQRIESLGQLTGGIAHDFNNMLASIIGFTELSLSVEKDKKITGYLKHVLRASEKCASLVEQMLTFSKTAADSEKQEDLSAFNFSDEVYKMLRPLLSSNCKLELKKLTDDHFIHINPAQIMLVMMNLYLNAKDSIGESQGTINIVVEKYQNHASDIFCSSCHQSFNGDFVSISIEDDGCGIENDIKKHLFEPFFSTKDVGKGTGMGLPIVHGIIHKHAGHVLLESKLNIGTKVKVLFPIVTSNKNIEYKNIIIDDNNTTPENNTKHILVVDDAVSLTIYLKEFLQLNNFRVTTFGDSEKALEYFIEHINDVDLVIVDQTIPNLSGVELAEKIFFHSETTPIILCSDHIEGLDDKINSSLNIIAYMEKPIKTDQLIKNIESIF